jgi:hypothetical protein
MVLCGEREGYILYCTVIGGGHPFRAQVTTRKNMHPSYIATTSCIEYIATTPNEFNCDVYDVCYICTLV